jgi:hypothetical protein
LPEPTYPDYLPLRKTDDTPPRSPEADTSRFYADGDGVLRVIQSDGTDSQVGGGGGGAGTSVYGPFTVDVSQSAVLASAGVEIYTPTVADILLDAWIEVGIAWDGTTPKGDIGSFVGANQGFFGMNNFAVDLTLADDEFPPGLLNANVSGTAASDLVILGASNFPTTLTRVAPAKFTTDDPLKVVVSQNGHIGGSDVGGTAGVLSVYLVVATPTTP